MLRFNLSFQQGEKFSELGILGPTKVIGNYPTNVTLGSVINLYGFLGNHEGTVEYYQILLEQGNTTTFISNSTAATRPDDKGVLLCSR